MEFGPSFASVAATLEHSSQQQQQHREPLSTNDDDKSKSMMTNLNPNPNLPPSILRQFTRDRRYTRVFFQTFKQFKLYIFRSPQNFSLNQIESRLSSHSLDCQRVLLLYIGYPGTNFATALRLSRKTHHQHSNHRALIFSTAATPTKLAPGHSAR